MAAVGETVRAAANATAGALQPSGGQLTDVDIERIADALLSRLHLPGGFKAFDFCLGVLCSVGLAAALFGKIRRRLTRRQNDRDAVEMLKGMDDESIKRLFGDSDMPSWVNFPDFERVGWINSVLSQLWPYLNSAVSQHFREILAPLLRDSKPSWIASLKLFRFDLGDAAPQANGVKVYDRAEQDGGVMIEVDFSWVGTQDVQLTIRPIPKHLGPLSPAGYLLSSIVRLRAGIERITVNGAVRFMWKPLLGELPIIGGVQVALVEMPKFSFDVTIYGGDASLVPGLEQWLTQFMKDTVFRPYILPERFSYNFTADAELEDLRPKGILFLKVLAARNVPKMDVFSQSDTYVKLSVRHAIQLRTSVKENNANPKWGENFKVLIHHPESQELTCVLMDFDDYNPDDEIGRCALPIRELRPEETRDFWLDVDVHATEEAATDEKHTKGFFEKALEVEQKVAAQGEKVWKRLPGVKQKNSVCQLHLQTTLYLLDSEDLEEAVRQDDAAAGEQPQQRRRQEHAAQPAQKNGRAERASGDIADTSPQASHTAQGAHDAPSADEEARREQGGSPGQDSGPDRGRDADEGASRPPSREPSASSAATEGVSKAAHAPEGASKSADNMSHDDVRKQALDALKGGILYVKPRKADGLKRKPWYKSFFLHSRAQLEVSVCGQHKSTASAVGSNPVFSETLEFLLGGRDIEGAEHKRLKIEVWDHRLRLNYFRGGCSLVLKDVIDHHRVKDTLRLTGVPHGELSLEAYWISALESAGQAQKQPQAGAAERH